MTSWGAIWGPGTGTVGDGEAGRGQIDVRALVVGDSHSRRMCRVPPTRTSTAQVGLGVGITLTHQFVRAGLGGATREDAPVRMCRTRL